MLAGGGVRPVSQLLSVQRTSPSAVSAGTAAGVAAANVSAVAAAVAAAAVHGLVGADVAGGVLRVGHHFVGDVLALSSQKLLQTDDGGEHQGDFTDEEGLAGDEGDGAEGQFTEDGGLEGHGGHQGSQNFGGLLLLAPALLGLDGVLLFGQTVDGITEGTSGRTHGINDFTTLKVNFDGVRLEEAGDAVPDDGLDGVVGVVGAWRTLAVVARFHDLHTLGHGDGVLVAQHLVDEREQLVLQTRHGVLPQAVGVDGVEQVALGLDGVAGAAGLLLGRQGARGGH